MREEAARSQHIRIRLNPFRAFPADRIAIHPNRDPLQAQM
jgi:hypothetical protein